LSIECSVGIALSDKRVQAGRKAEAVRDAGISLAKTVWNDSCRITWSKAVVRLARRQGSKMP
jgi:hypothetical protein